MIKKKDNLTEQEVKSESRKLEIAGYKKRLLTIASLLNPKEYLVDEDNLPSNKEKRYRMAWNPGE
jgi:hypothetical protein